MKRVVFIICLLFSIFFIFSNSVFASVVINEFAVDPKTDRNGDLNVGTSDEYFELYNSGSEDINLTGWSLLLIDTTNESHNITGIIFGGGHFSILNPTGTQNNDGQISLVYPNGSIIDIVSYGNYKDGNVSDNAPNGNSGGTFDECLARIPNGKDTNYDSKDFIKTACTFNNTNNFILINNKVNVSCAFENKNVTLSADVNATNISSVVFSYTINGTNKNASGLSSLGNLIGYEYTINSSEIIRGNLSWNIYANDSFGNVFSNGLKSFYVRNKTDLVINPSIPDGLNNWYVTEPLFTLIKDAMGLRRWYRWDSTSEILYTGTFGLDNIPNQPKNSSGILELNYWSEFTCGNETRQEKIFMVDLTSPKFKNFVPERNSTVYNARPDIEVYLDEVYQSNSGINKNNVIMKLDNNFIFPSVVDAGSIDAIARYKPSSDLSDGQHNINISVEDNAGRKSSLIWFFEVNTSFSLFNLTVNMPKNSSYETRRIDFNITTTEKVDKIEYINWNDKNPKWKKLCENCDEYGLKRKKSQTLNEGNNEITIKAVNEFGISKEKNITLFIDSKKPIISNILPIRNSVTNGAGFYIKYTEDNLKEISVNWNPVVVLNDCESGKNKNCSINLDLTDFDGQFIDYWFNVSDSIRSVKSKETRVKVDTTSPVLTVNIPNDNEVYERKVPFNISVGEEVTLEYYDQSIFNPSWKRLCTKCNEYGLDKNKLKSFKIGSHDIIIRAVDKAGNSDMETISFSVVGS